jgi:arylsulfatase A-like enzyme
MKHSIRPLLLLCTAALLASAGFAGAAAARRPNLLLILADDLGWKDTGYTGSDFYETPNLDRLAKQGMVFTAAYAGAGNCQPSRACLLSGQYTPRHGVYAVGDTDRGPGNLMRLLPVPNHHGLAAENVTLAEALKAAGYVTGIFGKWHLDGAEGAPPGAQGFDVVHESYAGWQGKDPLNPKGIYSLTRAAGEFMEQNRDRPFFAYLPHYAIHTGLQARDATLAKFKAKPPGQQHQNALYAGCTYDLDDGLGLLLRKLADLGLEQNTLVVFTSDNGGTQQSSQEPLRGNKGCYYEGGIREPFIARWPGVIQPGTTCSVPIINQDLYPTFLAAAGAPVPPGKVLDGENLRPLFNGGGTLQRQAIFWHFPGYLDAPVRRGRDPVFRTRPVSVIHQGDWKLHLYHEEWLLDGGRAGLATNRAVELYNLKDDLGERHDLAQSHPGKRDELLSDLLKWMGSVKAVLPTERNPGYDPAKPATGAKGGKKRAGPVAKTDKDE